MNNSNPNEEWCSWVESLLECSVVWVNKKIIYNDEDHQRKWEDISITPENYWVVCEILDLQEILIEEVETSKEQDYFKESIIDCKHASCKTEEGGVGFVGDC